MRGPDRQTESGIILLDRRRHWLALEWVLWLNMNSRLTYELACEPGCREAARPIDALRGWIGMQALGHLTTPCQRLRQELPMFCFQGAAARVGLSQPMHRLVPPCHVSLPARRRGADGDKDTYRAAFHLAGRLVDFNQVDFPHALMLQQQQVGTVPPRLPCSFRGFPAVAASLRQSRALPHWRPLKPAGQACGAAACTWMRAGTSQAACVTCTGCSPAGRGSRTHPRPPQATLLQPMAAWPSRHAHASD